MVDKVLFDGKARLLLGDCLSRLKDLPDNSVDSIVTDPPYGLGTPPDPVVVMKAWVEEGSAEVSGKGFMGKDWDAFVPQPVVWRECFRVLKPGGHLLCFSGTRTQDWMAMSLRFAGFEIRDLLAWTYGSGFPKSHNIGMAVDRLEGNEREVGELKFKGGTQLGIINDDNWKPKDVYETKGHSAWEGWGTALKPALEPITLARKPLSESTIAQNVLRWGTGGINIDENRIPFANETDQQISTDKNRHADFNSNEGIRVPTQGIYHGDNRPPENYDGNKGRFPANLVHDGSPEVLELFPDANGGSFPEKRGSSAFLGLGDAENRSAFTGSMGDHGSAARFFYCAKTSSAERELGLEHLQLNTDNLQGLDTRGRTLEREDGSKTLVERWQAAPRVNNHPTVKPISLMRWLVRLITPKEGVVLDPFVGSGSTGVAALIEGFSFVGIDLSEDYLEIATGRITAFREYDAITSNSPVPSPTDSQKTMEHFFGGKQK